MKSFHPIFILLPGFACRLIHVKPMTRICTFWARPSRPAWTRSSAVPSKARHTSLVYKLCKFHRGRRNSLACSLRYVSPCRDLDHRRGKHPPAREGLIFIMPKTTPNDRCGALQQTRCICAFILTCIREPSRGIL